MESEALNRQRKAFLHLFFMELLATILRGFGYI